jgi:hypothetical protein
MYLRDLFLGPQRGAVITFSISILVRKGLKEMPPFLEKAPPPDFDGPLRLREFVRNFTGYESDSMTSQLHALVAEAVTAFSSEIMHGDANHRAWLATAAQEFIHGKEISKPEAPHVANKEAAEAAARADAQHGVNDTL